MYSKSFLVTNWFNFFTIIICKKIDIGFNIKMEYLLKIGNLKYYFQRSGVLKINKKNNNYD